MSHLKPLPGNPADIRTEAQKLKDAAADMRDAASRIKKLTCYSDYSSAAVDAATDKADDIHDRLTAAGKRYAGAGTALATWAEELEDAQWDAKQAISKHDNATGSLQSAQASVCTAEAEVRKPNLLDTEAFTAKSQLAHASEQVTQAECDVRAAEAAYNRARAERDTAAKKAAAAIRECGKATNDSPIVGVAAWVDNNLDIVRQVLDIVAIGLLIVLCILTIIGSGGTAAFFWLTLLGYAVSAASVAATARQVKRGEADGVDLGIEVALAFIPFGLGKVAKRVIKVAVKNSPKEPGILRRVGIMRNRRIDGGTYQWSGSKKRASKNYMNQRELYMKRIGAAVDVVSSTSIEYVEHLAIPAFKDNLTYFLTGPILPMPGTGAVGR